MATAWRPVCLRELLPQATLVAVTGYQRDATRLEAAGFEHHLLKPIDMQLLTDLLAKAGPRYGD
jgi:two-component system CheB/CheR fusion protein